MTSSVPPVESNNGPDRDRIDQPDPDGSTPSQKMAAPLANLSGRSIAHFRLENQLGAGAMSSVYRAIDKGSGRAVALKMLLPGADGVARSRFRQEAETALQLDHPHIIRSYEIGETEAEGYAFIAMELVDGSSLAGLLEQHRQISIVDSCLILEHVARGLDYAHRRGIVHRDVKPSNILLQRAGENAPGAVHLSFLEHAVIPLLSDFGIARALDAPELTTMGRTVGTPSYMAPEQCSGSHEIDGRADIYALGTVFYRCLVGRPPFVGSTTQVLYAHVYNPLTIPDEVLVNLPMPVIDILRRSLAKDPRQRYATAAGMAIDMARITGGIQQPPPQGPVDLDEITATMTALPTADRTSSSTVIVPARTVAGDSTDDQRAAGSTAGQRGRRRSAQAGARREFNRLATGIGLALIAVLIVISIAAVQYFWPADDSIASRAPGVPEATVESEQNGTGDNELSNEEPTDPGEEADTNLVDDDAKNGENPATPTPVPTPFFEAESVWGDAKAFYLDRDWQRTLEQLVALFRTDDDFNQQLADYEGFQTQLAYDLLLADPAHPFWQENADRFELATVEAMLFETVLGLAAEANASRQADRAIDYLAEAQILRAGDVGIETLIQATNGVATATASAIPEARGILHEAYVAYATSMADRGDMCSAAEHLLAAQNLQVNLSLNATLTRYQDSCAQDTIVREAEPVLRQLSGWLLYSATGEDGDQISVIRLGSDGSSLTVLEGATHPSLSPNGERLAYFSTDDDRPGLFALDVGSGFPATLPDKNTIGLRLTEFFEDGSDAPVAWAPDNDRLAFGSTREGDRQSRVYSGWSGDSGSSRNIGLGADPAWRPGLDLIVQNGADETANRPGLWLRNSNGAAGEQLTPIKEDLRPTWNANGDQIFFTSNGRDGNWEIYRLDLGAATVSRLTDNPAIDVAPTISPDGEHVAFFSDRSGEWSIWARELNGDRVWRLADVAGTIPNWREHSLQWIE